MQRAVAPAFLLLSACLTDTDPAGAGALDAAQEPQADARADVADAQPEADAGADTGADAAASSPEPSLAELMRDYREWTPPKDAPQSISSEIFGLCRLPSLAEMMFAESEHGDGRYLQDWLNAPAQEAIEGHATTFPVGAAIVKEKLVNGASGFTLVARGLMIKREPGFDPAHGDWEFGYWEQASGLAAGAQTASTCGGCHAGAETDFVFLDKRWRLP